MEKTGEPCSPSQSVIPTEASASERSGEPTLRDQATRGSRTGTLCFLVGKCPPAHDLLVFSVLCLRGQVTAGRHCGRRCKI